MAFIVANASTGVVEQDTDQRLNSAEGADPPIARVVEHKLTIPVSADCHHRSIDVKTNLAPVGVRGFE